MNKNKKFFKIRWQLLLIILPVAIVPLVIVVSFSSNRIFKHLEEASHKLYSSILYQVANNVDFVYEQYARTLTNILKIPNVDKGLCWPPYKTPEEEIEISNMIKGRASIHRGERILEEGLRKTAQEKIDGDVFLYELDRKSLINNKDYVVHQLNFGLLEPDINAILKDPLFLKIKNDNSIKFIFGKFQDGVLKGLDSEKKAVMIFPYYPVPPERPEDSFTKFILVELYPDFIRKFYKNIIHLKYGTLYILDQFDNIIAVNHPSDEDYYEYDENKKSYILNNDNPNDPYEGMSFKEYKLLNTDSNILKLEKIRSLILSLNPDYFNNMDEWNNIFTNIHFIKYKNIKYMVILQYAKVSQCKFLYFYPVFQIHKPIYNIIVGILYITFFVILIIVFVSIFTSKIFTEPIKKLAISSEEISSGNFKTNVDTRNFYGEFLTLGNSFNYMAKTINDYSENLEQMVKKRTEELAKANAQIKKELEMAQKIQQAIIPKTFPKVNILKIYEVYQPMDELGGDFYDVFMLDNNKIVFLIVDVCGHGVSAALITTMAKVSFFNNSKLNISTDTVIANVNEEICNVIGENNSYFTAFYAIFDTKTKVLEYTNAGHNDIYVIRDNKDIISLNSNSPFVGMLKTFKYRAEKIQLKENDRLILYTDGIPEMRNWKKELYGDERFKNIILKYSFLPLEKMVKSIIKEVNNFRSGFKIFDDITILVIQILKDSIEININLNKIKEKIEEIHHEDDIYKNAFLKAIDLFNEEKYKDSIDLLYSVKPNFKRKKDKFFIYYLLGYNYYKMQDIDNCIKYLENAKKINTNDRDLLNFIELVKK
ncbi:MAG TPA: SpoIIE family protein phosphatase [Spirochaetota bacterium]|nr:SpoIIE family protein phosphatase [Spirochaetota bacterium]HOL56602.1 SpoIIE family protein phosphatase [Spirochaetota bacterium]HPP04025.1 SpoIIE family protein phosphatase [Spirochaetota bacterium]